MHRLTAFCTLMLGFAIRMPVIQGSLPPYPCPELVEIALQAADEACMEIGSNEACYGHSVIDAQAYPHVEALRFDRPGHTADLIDIQTMRLSTMDIETGAWGVAMMNVLAYIRNSQPENVTFLAFGDVEIENLIHPPVSLEVRATMPLDVRLAPVADAEVVASLRPGQTVLAKHRLVDSSWLRIEVPETHVVGWIPASEITSTDGLNALAVVDAFEPYYGPMQMLYFQSGVDDAACEQAPESGLLIQTPEGVAELNLVINEVNIQLSATAYVQAQPNGNMTVEVVEGWAVVGLPANGASVAISAGQQVTIPLDANLSPLGSINPSSATQKAALPIWVAGSTAVSESSLNRLSSGQSPAASGPAVSSGDSGGDYNSSYGGGQPASGRDGGRHDDDDDDDHDD